MGIFIEQHVRVITLHVICFWFFVLFKNNYNSLAANGQRTFTFSTATANECNSELHGSY